MKPSNNATDGKLAKWEKPVLSKFDIDVTVSDIRMGFNPGSDGDGGFMTSLS